MNGAPVTLPADPAYRRRVLLVATAGVLIAAALLLAVTQWACRWSWHISVGRVRTACAG